MRKRQSGFTLIELILVIGLMSLVMLLSFEEKQQELEAMKAKGTGEILFQYNNAVRSWLSNNIGAPAATKNGTAWLKHTSCPDGTSSVAYLPCNFPAGTTGNPISFGALSLTSYIESIGAHPNQITSVRTETSSFVIKGRQRANLSGISAIVAAAGRTNGITPVLMASEGSFTSNPSTASITMVASTNSSTDAWLRTDGSNFMNNNLTFNPNRDPGNREIRNISRLSNATDGIIFAGNIGGASLFSPEKFIVDADEEIIGTLKVENTKGSSVGLEVSSGDVNIPNGDLNASGRVVGKSFRDIDNAIYYLDPDETSVLKTLATQGTITSNDDIIGKADIKADENLIGKVFYDANDNSFFVDPDKLSQLNEIDAKGSVKVGEYIKLDKVSVAGTNCVSAGAGSISRDSDGATLSCQGGIWAKQGGEFEITEIVVAANSSGSGSRLVGYYKYCGLAGIGGERPHGAVVRSSTTPDASGNFPFVASWRGYGATMDLRVSCIR